MRILLIEDHQPCVEGFRCLMETYLPEAEVSHCTTLHDAIAALQEDAPYDVIVLDLGLPDAKETESVRVLVRLAPDIPIVVYTAHAQYRDACAEYGIGIYLVKADIDGYELASTLQRLIT